MSNYSPHFSSPFSASSPHSLFGLSKKEQVFESFTCTLWAKIFIPGHIYFTERNIYFYGETFGHENKIIISYTEIDHINKAKSLGPQTDSIEIHTKSKEDYDFTGFRDVDKAYEVLMMLSQRASSIESDHVASLDTFDGSRARAYSEDSPKEPQGTIVIYEVDKNKKPQETLKVGLPLSMEKFFDIFFSDEAVFSYAQSMELNGASDVELTKWRPSQEADNITIKEMTMIVKVHGVPFKSKARVQAVLICTKNNNEIQINIAKKTLDIPYSDAFQIEEKWCIQADEVSAGRCILTNTADTVFSKKVGVENIIRSRTYDSVKAEHDLWFKTAKSRHLIVESEYQYSTPILSPIKEKTSEKEKSKDVINNDNKNQVFGEHLQQEMGKKNSNVQRNKGIRFLIFILILLIIFLIISVVILYSKLSALETRFTNIERSWKKSVFDDMQEF